MRIKLVTSGKRYAEIEHELISRGFIIDEDADLIIIEKDLYVDHLFVKDIRNNEKVRVSTNEIVYIESFGHDVFINTLNEQYKTGDRLHQLQRLLDPVEFLRISNSVIISKKQIKRIKPALTSKFILTMTNGKTVDVTRSYYNIFRDNLGI